MIISLSNFAGVAPMLRPYALAPNQAQAAVNTRLWTGGLDSIREPLGITTVNKVGTKQSIYKFDQTSFDDAKYWLTWIDGVSCVKGQVAGDTQEKTYYTGDGLPKVTDSTLALAGQHNNYPAGYYNLGVPAPNTAPILNTTGTVSGVLETRAYVYTFVTGWGEESAPSPAGTVDTYPEQSVLMTSMAMPPTGAYNIVSKRIYRTSTGSAGTNYYFVSEIDASNDTFTDTVTSDLLGETLSTLTFDPPPAGLQGLVNMPNGIMAGFQGNDVYICEPYKPYAWPIDYMQSVDYPVVALAPLQQNLLVLTTGAPYMIALADPASATMQKLDIHQACVSRRSVAQFGNGVLYASPDGLVYVGTDGSNVVTQNWFTRKDWQQLNPKMLIGAQHDGRYYGFYYVNDSAKGGFIFDPQTQNGTFTFHDIWADACYADLVQDALFYIQGDTIYKWEGTDTLRPYRWRSKVFLTPKPTNFSAAQVIAASYTDITVNFYVDGSLAYSFQPASAAPFRLPSGFLGLSFEVEFLGTSTILAAHMAETVTELGNV